MSTEGGEHVFRSRRGAEWFSKRKRVLQAIEKLVVQGRRISFYAVADLAFISRSTLYEREDLCLLIESARERQTVGLASGADMINGLLEEENKRLLMENEHLKAEVAALCSECEQLRILVNRWA